MSRKQSVTDEEMLEAVHRSVVSQGAAFSMITVAKSLGISRPVFFQRFGTRSKLVLEALLPHIRPTAVVALLERGPNEGAPLAEQLLAVAEALETFFDEATPCLMALKELDLMSSVHHLEEGPKELLRALALWLTRSGKQRGEEVASAQSVALALVGAFQTRAFARHLGIVPKRSSATYRIDVVGLFIRGLGEARTRS